MRSSLPSRPNDEDIEERKKEEERERRIALGITGEEEEDDDEAEYRNEEQKTIERQVKKLASTHTARNDSTLSSLTRAENERKTRMLHPEVSFV